MRFMQIIESPDVHSARSRYLQRLGDRGVALEPGMAVYVETVHRSRPDARSWLCYIAQALQHAA